MRGTLTGGSVGLLRYPAMLPCFSRLWGMILHCRKSPCRLEITADSRGLASGFSCLGDHPRVCGEHFVPTIMGSVSLGSSRECGEHRTLTDENGEPWGSSPRMRGTHQIRDVSADIHGIIPAYAGNTGWLYFVKLRWTCSALNLDTVGVQLEHRRRLVPCFVVCLVYFMRECLFR